MKRIYTLLPAFFLALTLFIAGCGEDGPSPAPQISFPNQSSGSVTRGMGDTLALTVQVTSEEDLKEVKVYNSTSVSPDTVITSFSNKNNFTFTYTYVMNKRCKEVEIQVYAVPDNDQGAKSFFDVKPAKLGIQESGSIQHKFSNNNNAWDLDSNRVLTQSVDDAAYMDMMSTDADGETFTGSWEASSASGTQFVKANAYNFEKGCEAAAAYYFHEHQEQNKVINPLEGDIYIANLRNNGTYVPIRVESVDTSASNSGGDNGMIEFSYKK